MVYKYNDFMKYKAVNDISVKSINQSMFYFMFVYNDVILEGKTAAYIIILY